MAVLRLFVVMGVAGCGKSTIGAGIATSIGGTYIDGDDFHPARNIEKMSNGQALSDADRWPWLARVASELVARDGIVLVGCSALKKSYRDFIRQNAASKNGIEPLQFIYLRGSKELIASRMTARAGHFMPTSLLESQFTTLEAPDASEEAIIVDIDETPEAVVATIVDHIRQQQKQEK